MTQKLLTWNPGVSAQMEDKIGQPILVSYIATAISGKRREQKAHAPIGWTLEGFFSALVVAIRIDLGENPSNVHFIKVEDDPTKLN